MPFLCDLFVRGNLGLLHDDDGLEIGLKLVGALELRRSVCAVCAYFYCLVPFFCELLVWVSCMMPMIFSLD